MAKFSGIGAIQSVVPGLAAAPDLSAAPSAEASSLVLTLDASTTYHWTQSFGPANTVILGSARDDADPTGHSYVIELNDRDFGYTADFMTIDGSALQGDTDGPGPLFDENATITTEHVTRYNAMITTGGGYDAVFSGAGSDTIDTGAAMDYVSIGSGRDHVSMGDGDDYIDSLASDFNSKDVIDGGEGNDELSLYYQNTSDSDFRNVSSMEILGLSSGGNLELDRFAFQAGVNTLYVDDSVHDITVGRHFTGAVDFNMMGDASGQTRLDASHSSATVTVHSEYILADTRPVLLGGTGKHDTVYVSSGFEGGPMLGGDLSDIRHFENVIVHTDAGGGGASLTLATRSGQIESRFLNLDASALTTSDALSLDASRASASIHVLGGGAGDTLVLGSGADRIEAGGGADLLTGGAGKDLFVYSALADSSSEGADTITDFHSGQDRIDVRGIGADQPDLSGETISFFGNQDGGVGDDSAFAATGSNGVLDAVLRADTHTLWFDTNDNGVLEASDLHMVLDDVDTLRAADVMSGHLVV